MGKLAAIPSIDWASLFPTRAEDKWSKNLDRFRSKHPKGSKAAKRILGKRAGQARRKSRIEKTAKSNGKTNALGTPGRQVGRPV